MATNSTLPDGVSEPLEVISDDDQRGLVVVLAACAISLVLLSVPIRIYARNKTGELKMDDWTFLGLYAFACVQVATLFYAVHYGFGGSDFDSTSLTRLDKAAYTSDILYISTLALSKLSTAFLLLRLTPGKGHLLAIWSTIGGLIAWALVSIILVAVRCGFHAPWTDPTLSCTHIFTRWQFISALDIITEVALFLLSVYVVWGVQINLRSKAIVLGAFGCRLPIIALAVIRNHLLGIAFQSSNNYLLEAAVACATQVEIAYSITASIVPCLRAFMAPYDRTMPDSSKYHSSAHESNLKLSTFSSTSGKAVPEIGKAPQPAPTSKNTGSGKHVPEIFSGKLRPDYTMYEVNVTNNRSQEARASVDSENSRRMIIKKGLEWSVYTGSRFAKLRGNEAA